MDKEPRPVLESIWAFPPSRDTLGGTAYFLILENSQTVLIDCPAWNAATAAFLAQHGGVTWLVTTHRQGMSPAIAAIQAQFHCAVVVQAQEAYLLPEVEVTPFEQSLTLTDHCRLLWTPGHSPGASCVYCDRHGGVLFTGRHLLPDREGNPTPLRTAKTFHWPRQLRSVQFLLDAFSEETLQHLCPGANLGFLRQQRSIVSAYRKLQQLDLMTLAQTQPVL